jgi:hypothetical protein
MPSRRADGWPGQTFVIFPEVDRVIEKEQITWGELKAVLARLEEARQVRYRVYRHTAPITAATLCFTTASPWVGCKHVSSATVTAAR